MFDLYYLHDYNNGMSEAMEAVRRQALALSASEWASLAHDLILSFDDSDSYELDQDQEAEIQNRVRRVQEVRATGRPAVELFADIKAQTKPP